MSDRRLCTYLVFREMAVKHEGMFCSLFCYFDNKVGRRHNIFLLRNENLCNVHSFSPHDCSHFRYIFNQQDHYNLPLLLVLPTSAVLDLLPPPQSSEGYCC